MKKSITHQFSFPQPPEQVWEYLTNADLMALWLMKNDFKPVVGAEFQFNINPMPALEFDGIVYCKVLELIPFKKLSYSWKSGPGNGEITVDTVVVWKLEPKGNGTELFLEHSGFTEKVNLNLYHGLTDGWLKNIQKIANLLNETQHANSNA
jgi:uncharacterized protein YndB with AHSA1/START domain